MHAIILTDNQNTNLGALNDRVLPALLPVAGRPVVLHLLEQLHRSGIRSVSVISPSAYTELERAIDTRPLLGMDVTFLSKMPLLRRFDDNILMIGTHQLVDFNWEFVKALHSNSHTYGVTKLTTSPADIVGLLFHAHTAQLVPDVWGDFSALEKSISIGQPKVLKLDSLAEYRDANFELLNGNCTHLFAAGRQLTPNMRVAPKALAPEKVMRGKHAYIGMHSRIDATVKLCGNVVIGDDVFIDKHACITNSIILDGTYIGAMTSIDDAIVKGNMLIKINSGICLTIDDPVLLSTAV
jgi:NDP-sugar pyrophosphorylase family protein